MPGLEGLFTQGEYPGGFSNKEMLFQEFLNKQKQFKQSKQIDPNDYTNAGASLRQSLNNWVPITSQNIGNKFQEVLGKLTKNPEVYIPGYDPENKRPIHGGDVGQVLNAFQSFIPNKGGMLAKVDETGGIGISPLTGALNIQSTKGWGLNLNPLTKSVGMNAGQFTAGANLNPVAPAGYIGYGPVNLQGSWGPDKSIQLNVDIGNKDGIQMPPIMMQEFLNEGSRTTPSVGPNAREELESVVQKYRQANPDSWWRPF